MFGTFGDADFKRFSRGHAYGLVGAVGRFQERNLERVAYIRAVGFDGLVFLARAAPSTVFEKAVERIFCRFLAAAFIRAIAVTIMSPKACTLIALGINFAVVEFAAFQRI